MAVEIRLNWQEWSQKCGRFRIRPRHTQDGTFREPAELPEDLAAWAVEQDIAIALYEEYERSSAPNRTTIAYRFVAAFENEAGATLFKLMWLG